MYLRKVTVSEVMKYETVIGLEVHVELASKSKLFCSCTTEFGGEPNTHCCPVCTGMPGTLPVFNRKVLEFAVKAGLALGCDITRVFHFDRKNYFYPDLPKAYQISQLYAPVAVNGHTEIKTADGNKKVIRIHEMHMEEDAGKIVHSPDGKTAFLDYNRCGVPLVEIVTEPDFRNAEEVNAFLYRLRSVFKYLGISDCKMEEGSMRADVNLSVRPEGSEEFGTRSEMKNINSFRAIERAIAYESARQIKTVENGGTIIQETRRWDNASGRSFAMRSKEETKDYRYFPEPDLPAFHISDEEIRRCRDLIPEFADERAERLVREMSLPEEDAVLITASRNLADLFEDTVKICGAPAEVRFWFTGGLLSFINETGRDPEDIALSPEKFAEFAGLVVSGELKREAGKKVFRALLESDGELDLRKFIKENGLETLDDNELIAETVRKVIAENPKPFEQYRNGETKVFGFFVGRVMKELKGRADPSAVNSTVKNILENYS